MLVFDEYGGKVRSPQPLPRSRLGKKVLNTREEWMTFRFPDSGPLNIENNSKYLQLSRKFFTAHYGKPSTIKLNIEDFDLLYEIGRGTFGYVVLAKHISSKNNYSIKIMSKEKLIKMKSVEQTLKEKNILQGLNSPFTIYLLYFFKDNSYIYLVMPFVEGGELYDYLTKVGQLKEQQAQFYSSQVVLGLEYLHSLDLIHRDLKPENILLDHTGYIKLADFGFSKVLTNHRTYTLCGTPEYMAPEIILNKGHGMPADWWAAGVLMYELVSGHTPFHHTNKLRIYEKVVTNSYEMNESISDGLKDLISNLLQADITKRYGNLKGGVNDIKHHRWFRTTNWLAVLNRKITPVFIPKHQHEIFVKRPVMNLKVEAVDNYAEHFSMFDD